MRQMTLGQIVDYCIEVDNQDHKNEKRKEQTTIRRMTQDEINAFLG